MIINYGEVRIPKRYRCVTKSFEATAQGDAGVEVEGSQWDVKTPLFVSEHGFSLCALNEDGFPADPEEISLRVREEQIGDDTVTWDIIDTDGTPRPIYFRIRYKETAWVPTELYRGDWAKGARALFVPVATRDDDLDVGICLLRSERTNIENCQQKVVAREGVIDALLSHFTFNPVYHVESGDFGWATAEPDCRQVSGSGF